MTNQQKFSKAMHISLWAAQIVLAIVFIWAAMMKLFQPAEKLAAMWPWTGQVPASLVKFTGIVDLLGGIGLVLPSLLHIKPKLTPITAIGIIVLMVCGSVFHILRGEASAIRVNIIFTCIAIFIAWGRFRNARPQLYKYTQITQEAKG
jgi:uncharacterized membrane protein YphA (DoxX/SURF4 family)